MALIRCPECGKEVSDQAKACIHCGYPLAETRVERYALILMDLNSDYSGNISLVQEQLKLDDYTQAKALVDAVPVVLRRGLTYEECLDLVRRFQPKAVVKMVRDAGCGEAELVEAKGVDLPPAAVKEPIGFIGVFCAVILGVFAAVFIGQAVGIF